jgi:hypothetical protein
VNEEELAEDAVSREPVSGEIPDNREKYREFCLVKRAKVRYTPQKHWGKWLLG